MTEAKTGLYAALAALQKELPKVGKGQTGKVEGEKDGRRYSYEYKYAGLDVVSEAILPLLGKHGLAFTSKPTTNDKGEFVLAYKLVHESGEDDEGEYLLPNPQRVKPQTVGSAITYARRYSLCAVTGLAPDSDDDAREAQEAPQEAWENARPAAPKQQQDWRHPPPRPPGDLPRNADGSLSRSRATDAELAAAGAMTSTQLKEHTALRKGAVTGKTAGTVERIHGKAPDDQWTVEAEIDPQDLKPIADITDEKWYSGIVREALTFRDQGDAGTLRRRISEKEEANGCSEADGERLRALIREHQRELATGGGSDAA